MSDDTHTHDHSGDKNVENELAREHIDHVHPRENDGNQHSNQREHHEHEHVDGGQKSSRG
jgi:hypothetical protein